MFLKKSVVILCTIFVFSDGGIVDTLGKCGKNDGQCHKKLFQHVLQEASKTGIPEANIPPFDPVALKDVHVPILNIADLHMPEGVLKGLRKCVVNDFFTSIEEGRSSVDLTCDLTLKGRYKAFADSPFVKSLFGVDTIRGDGNVKIKIEKLNLKLDLNFHIGQQNGDTYIKQGKQPTYKFDILGRVVFAADHIYLGEEDASARITNLLNENWKIVVGTVGNQFMERAVGTISNFLRSFFDHVPTKLIITDDLTPYVK